MQPSREHSHVCPSREPATPGEAAQIAVGEMLLARPLLRARAIRMMIGQQNMPRTFMIVIWLALVVPSVAHAQIGNWLQKGVSGFGAEAGVTHQDGDTAFLLTGEYSHQGFLDVFLNLGWHDTAIPIPDLSVYSLGAELDYHPLKQTKEVPLSLKVGIAYTQLLFSSEMLRENDETRSYWQTVLGGGIYRFFRLEERIGVTPELDLGWNHSSATRTILDQSQTVTGDAFVIGLTAAFAYLDSAGHIWGVAPLLGFGPGNTPTTFGISATFISTIPGAR
ncbi:MAG TPA: hypothetical protein VHT91_37470 [Kofleriaceae bacterium]|nr:hypothetical protein [Kofleriaceae bacterium]